MTGNKGMGQEHEECGSELYQPRIAFKDGLKTIFEKTGDYVWCRQCQKFVKLEVRQK